MIFKCPFCKKKYVDKGALMNHMYKEHNDECHGLPPQQIYFNYTNKYALTKENGISVMSGKPTKFNLVTGRYERFADDADREAYREMFKKRMRSKYGKDTLLDEPEQQVKMLASRHISGKYSWGDGTETVYTGSYERKFLEYIDTYLGWENGTDIMAPAPMTFPYIDADGKQRFHIPDFYITSLNLIINIKSSENKHYRLRDIETEKLQDKAIEKSKFNYLKIYDNEFSKLTNLIDTIKKQPERRFLIESVTLFENQQDLD